MPIEILPSDDEADLNEPKRDRWQAMRRGAFGRCPNCGRGRMFYRYLKVNDRCPDCGEELFHHRADDAPPYFTILVVGHVIGAGILSVDAASPYLPLIYPTIAWPLLTVAMVLAFLPMAKGGLIGLQWALRMHGFGGPEEGPAPVPVRTHQ